MTSKHPSTADSSDNNIIKSEEKKDAAMSSFPATFGVAAKTTTTTASGFNFNLATTIAATTVSTTNLTTSSIVPVFSFSQHRMTGQFQLPVDDKQLGQIDGVKSTYTWKICDFRELCCYKLKEEIKSPVFMVFDDSVAKSCRLRLYPHGKSAKCADYLSLFVQCQIDHTVKVQVSLSILNGKKQRTNDLPCFERISTFTEKSSIWGSSKFLSKDILLDPANNLLPNGNITIICDIILKSSDIELTVLPRLKIHEDFERLLDNEKFSDLILEVEDEEIKVHKYILAARSLTFCEILKDEESKSHLKITDVKHNVMKEVIRFIYTEKVEQLPELANDLLIAAHKYKLEDLKMKCEEVLFEKLEVSNAFNIYVLSDNYDAKRLKRNALNFIVSNIRQTIDTAGYKTLADSHPQLLDELFRTVIKCIYEEKIYIDPL